MKVARIMAACAVWLAMAGYAHAIDECSGGNRAERRLSCVVDGDTLWEKGKKLRMLDIDAPETFGAACERERKIGDAAKERLIALMNRGYRIEYSGNKDRTSDKRDLVHVILNDGRDAGTVLMKEGLAQAWPNRGNQWCGR